MIKEDQKNSDDEMEDSYELNQSIIRDDEENFIEEVSIDDDTEFILDEDEVLPEDHDMSGEKKYKLIGKHSLKYDTIFRGKKSNTEEEDMSSEGEYYTNSSEFDPSESFIEQTIDSEDSARTRLLKQRVLDAVQQIGINTKVHRRKPSKSDFNRNYQRVVAMLRPDGLTPVEIFVEYADYFSDNLYNMFTMLDAEIGAALIKELKEKKNLSFLNDVDFL